MTPVVEWSTAAVRGYITMLEARTALSEFEATRLEQAREELERREREERQGPSPGKAQT